jgi:hypothetical protein
VLNDRNWPGHNAQRWLEYEGGSRRFSAAEAERDEPLGLTSQWFNLDDLGIVRLAASGEARYVPKPTGAAGRLEQRFHLNAVAAPRDTAAGAVLAHSVLVFYPGQAAAATREAAARCRLVSTAGADEVRLVLEDGLEVKLDLARLLIE